MDSEVETMVYVPCHYVLVILGCFGYKAEELLSFVLIYTNGDNKYGAARGAFSFDARKVQRKFVSFTLNSL